MNEAPRRITYANVVSTLALFLAVSGGAAYAAVHLGSHTVGTKQLKRHSVGTKQLKHNAVTGADVKNGSLTAADFKAGTLPTGAEVSDLYSAKGTLTVIPSGESATLASLTLPAGEYEVIASQVAQPSEGTAELDCYIYAGETQEASFYTKLSVGLAGGLTGMATPTLTATTEVTDVCYAYEEKVIIPEPKLVALKVGAIH